MFPHATGRWAKKIAGRFVFVGSWEDPEGALARFVGQRHALFGGRTLNDVPSLNWYGLRVRATGFGPMEVARQKCFGATQPGQVY